LHSPALIAVNNQKIHDLTLEINRLRLENQRLAAGLEPGLGSFDDRYL
jgi:hypothetical protein